MIKNIIIGLFLVLFWASLAIGTSSPLYYRLLQKEVIPNQELYGDLYRFTNLKQFKLIAPNCPRPYANIDTTQKQNIALYSIGDSFLEPWRINENDFPYKNYKSIHWFEENIRINLDPHKKNVLLIECVERHSRERFGIVPPNYLVIDSTYVEPAWIPQSRLVRAKNMLLDYWSKYKLNTFTPEASDHLEHVFFSFDWLLPIKELKSKFNLDIFGRVNPSAGISKDRQHIFYFKDTDSTLINSSYNPISDIELDAMVANMDSTVKYYKIRGFDEVVVSMIPNKASILAQNDGTYNHLVERFELKAKTKFSVASVYNEYMQNKSTVFGVNETHWTCFGKNIWLKNVTDQIEKGLKK